MSGFVNLVDGAALLSYPTGMPKVTGGLRIAAWFCLLLVLLAAVTPTAAYLALGILTVFWFFVGQVSFAFIPDAVNPINSLPSLALPTFSPRPPPEVK
jgi:hypothetical protein